MPLRRRNVTAARMSARTSGIFAGWSRSQSPTAWGNYFQEQDQLVARGGAVAQIAVHVGIAAPIGHVAGMAGGVQIRARPVERNEAM